MILKDQDGREVELFTGGNTEDDIEIHEATYVDTGDDASDESVEHIYDTYPDKLHEDWYQGAIMRAESYYEGDR